MKAIELNSKKKKWTPEAIKALADKPYNELTNEERRIVNLNKNLWYKGMESPNPTGGRKKADGTSVPVTNWSRHFRKLMGDKKFLKTIINGMPAGWDEMVEETPAEFIAACLIAVVARGTAESMTTGKGFNNDTRQALALLNKFGYGDRVVLDAAESDSPFTRPLLNFTVVPDRTDINRQDSETVQAS